MSLVRIVSKPTILADIRHVCIETFEKAESLHVVFTQLQTIHNLMESIDELREMRTGRRSIAASALCQIWFGLLTRFLLIRHDAITQRMSRHLAVERKISTEFATTLTQAI
jgi:hypothetical protein